MDTTGLSLNNFAVTFQSIPSNFSPFALGNSWNTSRTGESLLPSGGALNLFALSGGNFSSGRKVTWPSLPGEQILVTSNVSTANGIQTFADDVNGTYTGPTDLIGVSNYKMLWTQLSPTSIVITTTATLLEANGKSFTADISTVYTGLSVPMPTSQHGAVTFSDEAFRNGTLSYDWVGTVAPVAEPGTGLLIALGLLGTLARQVSAKNGGFYKRN